MSFEPDRQGADRGPILLVDSQPLVTIADGLAIIEPCSGTEPLCRMAIPLPVYAAWIEGERERVMMWFAGHGDLVELG